MGKGEQVAAVSYVFLKQGDWLHPLGGVRHILSGALLAVLGRLGFLWHVAETRNGTAVLFLRKGCGGDERVEVGGEFGGRGGGADREDRIRRAVL